MKQTVIRRPVVLSLTGISTSHLYALMADDKFPRPIKLGARSVGWLEGEVLAWLESRKAQRDAA